jgi:ribosome-binding protein aMBF1 (putative translation factor)
MDKELHKIQNIEDPQEFLDAFFKHLNTKNDPVRAERILFINMLTRARHKKGWSQAELARQAKMPQSAIGRIERVHGNPSLTTLLKIAKSLGVNLMVE